MPVPAQANDYFQVRIVGRQSGQETNMVWHFRAATAIDDVDLRLIQAIFDCFVQHLLPVLSSAWVLEKIVYKRVSPTLGPEYAFVPQNAAAGAGNAQALPSFCSAVVSIRTDVGGRSHRGRTYIPGIPENATLNDSFDPGHAFWLGLVAFAACLAGKFLAKDPQPVNTFLWQVYSRKIGGQHFPYGAGGFTTVTDILPVTLIGSTRSRKVGRGS
ncbi:MAG TPA: hypothetical protein VKG87_09440 [Terriglobales bacterium]|nr:hypothetical protein [Terriglobales bacterium]